MGLFVEALTHSVDGQTTCTLCLMLQKPHVILLMFNAGRVTAA